MTAADHQSQDSVHHQESHPGVMAYVIIALILTVITALEVAIFYIPALEPALVPLLFTLSAGKFVLVVMFYMHLKTDSRVFSAVFVAPLLLAVFMVAALVILFKVLPLYG
ncbi:MAG: cytochrome C oxidase subunit IV family protein [Gemmatimonadota bacterium]